jgi:hypothetical protein
MIIKYVVRRYATTSDGVWSGSYTDVTDAFNIRASVAMGIANDIFSFKVPNNRDKNITNFYRQDKVELYLSINNVSTLIMTGLIKNITENISDRAKHLTIDCVSFSELVTQGLTFGTTGTGHSMDVMEFLEACLNSVKVRNEKFPVTWDTANNPTQKWNSTTNDYTGGAFPTLNSGNEVREFDKSLAATLDKYLVNAYTGDGQYIWFVSNDNKLCIRKKSVGSSAGTLTEGVDFKTGKFSFDISNVKNYVIVKCGKDLNTPPRPISVKREDLVSRAKYGFRYYLLVDTKIADAVYEADNYGGTNAGFRAAVEAAGEAAGDALIGNTNKGLYSGTLNLAPTTDYTVGQRILVTASSFGLLNKELRIKEISWDEDSTTLTLEEEVLI